MNDWQTIAIAALALSLILPSAALPQERPRHGTGQAMEMDRAEGFIVLCTGQGPM